MAPPDPPPQPVFPHPAVVLRFGLLTGLLAAALAAGFLLSHRLWLSDRSYPLTPVCDCLPALAPPLDGYWFGAILFVLGALVFLPFQRWLLTGLLALALFAALGDQTRWQPWFYQYLAMFGALAWAAWKTDASSREAALHTCRFIVAATYFWSGIQKMNAAFLEEIYPWLMEPILKQIPPAWHPWVMDAGAVVPFLEAGIGIGLLVRPLRLPTMAAALFMHLLLLFVLGPAGHDWNSVVWPWNAAMAAMVVLLFWRAPDLSARDILWPRDFAYARAVLFFFGLLPGLHLVGWWDAYLSASLYSGNTLDAEMVIPYDETEGLPSGALEDLYPTEDGWQLDFSTWSMRELNVPPYPARRVYLRIARNLARRTDPPAGIVLVIHEQPHWRTGKRNLTYLPCGE